MVFQVFGGFSFTIWTPPTLEGPIWLISSCYSTIQLSVGAQIVGLQFLFGHEIQRSTLYKFADLWATKSYVTGLATLVGSASHFGNVPHQYFFSQFAIGVRVVSIPRQIQTHFVKLATLFQGTHKTAASRQKCDDAPPPPPAQNNCCGFLVILNEKPPLY
jgi:hypothetical protein